jgi:hypothetical protein
MHVVKSANPYQVDEAVGRLGDPRHALNRGGGRGEQHQVNAGVLAHLGQHGRLLEVGGGGGGGTPRLWLSTTTAVINWVFRRYALLLLVALSLPGVGIVVVICVP